MRREDVSEKSDEIRVRNQSGRETAAVQDASRSRERGKISQQIKEAYIRVDM
jgi:hypothetical protein